MLIEAEDLKLTLGQCTILNGVSLHLNEGEIYGLLGRTGAGKSATIRVLLGQYPRCGGRLSVLGVDPAQAAVEIRRRVGVMTGDTACHHWMTVGGCLKWYAGFYGHRIHPAGVVGLLRQVGLAEAEGRIVDRLPVVLRRRLGLARALLGEPRLLILDEPTLGLDARGRREFQELLLGLVRGRGMGILLCAQTLADVDPLCGRIGVIHEGRTLREGPIPGVSTRQGPANGSSRPIRGSSATSRDA